MPPALEEYEQLPFPVGQSPFKVKGTAYRGHIEYVDAKVPGGMKAVIAALNDSAHKNFFLQPFMASSLYDVYPLVVMGYVGARLSGSAFADYMRARTRYQAEIDLSGVHRLLLKLASPDLVAKRLPQITAQYFNFGVGKITRHDPGLVEAVRRGIPAGLAEWYAAVGSNYVVRALELNGARNPIAHVLPLKKEGKAFGVELTTMTFHFLWER